MKLVKLTKEERDEMRGRLSKVRSAIDNNAKPEARELVNELQRDLKKLPNLEAGETILVDDPEKEVDEKESEKSGEAGQDKDSTTQSTQEEVKRESGIDAEKRAEETRKETVKGYGEDERAEELDEKESSGSEEPSSTGEEDSDTSEESGDSNKVSFN